MPQKIMGFKAFRALDAEHVGTSEALRFPIRDPLVVCGSMFIFCTPFFTFNF